MTEQNFLQAPPLDPPAEQPNQEEPGSSGADDRALHAAQAVSAIPPALMDLFQQLAEEPYSFDFFQAVRRMECAAPELPRIGTSIRAQHDPLRFTQSPSLAFSPAALSAFHPPSEDAPAQLSVNFMGMWGPNGPLPLHLTEYARERQRNVGDATFARFMDVFHHRMTSLFYRAWAAAQQTVSADHSLAPDGSDPPPDVAHRLDRFAAYVSSFIGRGMPSWRQRDSVPDSAKLYWAGHLAANAPRAEGLESILSTHFRTACAVFPFAGQWIDIPLESRCLLGRSPETGSLGQTSIVGSQVWDCQGKFRLRLGPMDLEPFNRLLPNQAGNRQLRDWIRNYVGDQLAWEARIVLSAKSVPGVRLDGNLQLGLSTWLPTTGPRRDVDDLVLHS